MFFAFTVTLLLLTMNVVPGTDAGGHGHGDHGIGALLASGIIVSLLRGGNGRRRRSVDEENHVQYAY